MTWRRSHRYGKPGEVHFEELLRYEDDASTAEAPAERPWRLRALGFAFALSAVAYTVIRAFGYAPPYLLIAAVSVGCVLVRRAIVVASEPDPIRARDLVRSPRPARQIGGGWYTSGDGMLTAMRSWNRRLEWGAISPGRFTRSVPGRLGEVVDERLRQRHGITRAGDPTRARALLGDDLWTFLHEPVTHVPTPRQMAAVIDRMESV
jgi:hypothetical protein